MNHLDNFFFGDAVRSENIEQGKLIGIFWFFFLNGYSTSLTEFVLLSVIVFPVLLFSLHSKTHHVEYSAASPLKPLITAHITHYSSQHWWPILRNSLINPFLLSFITAISHLNWILPSPKLNQIYVSYFTKSHVLRVVASQLPRHNLRYITKYNYRKNPQLMIKKPPVRKISSLIDKEDPSVV